MGGVGDAIADGCGSIHCQDLVCDMDVDLGVGVEGSRLEPIEVVGLPKTAAINAR